MRFNIMTRYTQLHIKQIISKAYRLAFIKMVTAHIFNIRVFIELGLEQSENIERPEFFSGRPDRCPRSWTVNVNNRIGRCKDGDEVTHFTIGLKVTK